ncbi:MAG TPA: winged helix-turn-helix domain-containing protein [Blastocatellia bacterium]|nr:winged helix-turn-helix domain-containing protein [Blastocatellia bacterium]
MGLQTKHIYEFGPFRLDAAEHLLLRDGEAVPLTPKAFDLLLALVERHGHLLEKDELLKKVWPDTFVEEANLASNISQLRKALGDGENGHRYIETAPKRGYRFVANVKKVEDDGAGPTIQEKPGSLSTLAKHEQEANADALITSHPALKLERPAIKVKYYQRGALIALAALILSTGGLAYFVLRSPLAPKVMASVQITTSGRGKSFYLTTGGFRMSSPVVTDGPRLFFTQGAVPTQVSSTGGETVTLASSFSRFIIGDISPDRSELLVSRADDEFEGTLWVLPVLGGAPRRLGALVGHDATWTPDGKQIVYVNGSALYRAKSDGTESRKFVTVDGRPYWPRWAPDGSRLRFTVQNPAGSDSLWEVAADSANPHPLLPGWNNPANECCGNWTADGRYFFFQSTRNRSTNIWATREQTGLFQRGSQEPVQLTIGPLNYYFPAPSLDGKKLFVVGEQKRGELSRYDAKKRQLVSYLGGISAEYLDFSRDGEWIAYVNYPEGSLWRSKVGGEERRQLSFSQMRAALPRWSPDGKQIVFMASTPGKRWKTYLISADGGTPQQLMPDERSEYDPGWSPDGNTLVFAARTNRELSDLAIYLFEMGTRQLSKLPGSEGLYSPRWSPDGRYIAAHNGGLQNRLLLFDITTQKWTELLAGQQASGPHWSRDGKYIYFVSSDGGERIFRLGIGDRKVELCASLKGFRLAQSVFGIWFGWTPDDQPLMLRDEGTQDIYALEWQIP